MSSTSCHRHTVNSWPGCEAPRCDWKVLEYIAQSVPAFWYLRPLAWGDYFKHEHVSFLAIKMQWLMWMRYTEKIKERSVGWKLLISLPPPALSSCSRAGIRTTSWCLWSSSLPRWLGAPRKYKHQHTTKPLLNTKSSWKIMRTSHMIFTTPSKHAMTKCGLCMGPIAWRLWYFVLIIEEGHIVWDEIHLVVKPFVINWARDAAGGENRSEMKTS